MRNIFLTGIIILCCCFAHAQQVIQVRQIDGKNVGTDKITLALLHIIDTAHIAGLQVAIIKRHQIVYTHSFGFKSAEKRLALNDSTEMYAASLTKPVSAYLFMRLVNQGLFNLDTPVYRYVNKPIASYPKWKDLADDTVAFKKITARMLLSHTSGMPVLRALYRNKTSLIAKPGEKFYYSNEGMNFLGFVIEERTGKRLEVLTKQEVFAPLQMLHTSMVWEPAFEQNYADAYFKDGKNFGMEKRESARAAGSMTVTAIDYAKFVINLMQQKGLPISLYKQMTTPQVSIVTKRGFGPLKDSLTHDNDKIGLAWGLGLTLIKTTQGNAFLHGGHGDANQNYFIAYPGKDIAIVLLSNSENFEHGAAAMLKVCIGDVSSPLKWMGYNDNY